MKKLPIIASSLYSSNISVLQSFGDYFMSINYDELTRLLREGLLGSASGVLTIG